MQLSREHAHFVDELVESGAFPTAEDVVGAGLAALRVRRAEERWLHEEVAPVLDAMAADPDRAIAADTVFEAVRARHGARVRREG